MNRASLVAEAEAIRARLSDININEVPADQVEAVTADIARAEELDAEVDKLDALAERAKAVTSRVTSGEIKQERAAAPTTFVRSTDADLYDLSSVDRSSVEANRSDLIARALTAVERNAERAFTDDQREAVTNKISTSGRNAGKIAEYVLQTGSPEYAAEFERFIATSGRAFGPQLERAAMSLTTANGGAMVPYILDPSVMLTNNGVTNPMRQLARTETIIGANEWRGVTSAGVSAEWLAESTEAADASPTFTQPAIPTFKAAAYLFGSYEVLADSGFASQVQPLIMDAKDRLEATAFATGTGSGQPFGIVTALGLTTTSRVAGSSGAAGAADLVAADIYALDNDLGDRYRQNASFVGNKKTWNTVRQFGTANNYHAFWTDFGGGLPPQLIGYPVYQASAMDSTIVSGSNDDVIVLGDFQNYVVVDRMGLELVYNPLVMGANNRPSGEVGWVAFWRTGGDSVNDAAFRMLRV